MKNTPENVGLGFSSQNTGPLLFQNMNVINGNLIG